MIRLAGGRPAFQITKQGLTGVLRQRQADFVASLAQDPQGAAFPLDVVQAKSSHIARPQPQPHQ